MDTQRQLIKGGILSTLVPRLSLFFFPCRRGKGRRPKERVWILLSSLPHCFCFDSSFYWCLYDLYTYFFLYNLTPSRFSVPGFTFGSVQVSTIRGHDPDGQQARRYSLVFSISWYRFTHVFVLVNKRGMLLAERWARQCSLFHCSSQFPI